MKKFLNVLFIVGSLSLAACAQTPEEELAVEAQQSALIAATYKVGPGQPYGSFSALPALKPGDVVEVMGGATYGAVTFRASGTAASKITVRGVKVNGKRPVISGGVNTVQFELSNHMVFEGFEVTGGSSRCVFNHANDITIRDTIVRDCPMHGILAADNDTGSLTLDHVEVRRSGYGDQKHPIYVTTDQAKFPGAVFKMEHCYLHDQNGGHGVKSRAERNEIRYNWIEGSYYHELELIGPDPSAGFSESLKREDSQVIGNVIRKTGARPGGHAVRIGGDGTGQTRGRYRFVNNTFLMGVGTGSAIRVFDAVDSVEAHNNIFYREGGATIELLRTTEASTAPTVLGTRNWATSGSRIPTGWTGTLTGSAPGFTSLSGLDLRPSSTAAVLNQGAINPPTISSKPFPSPLGIPAYEPAVRNAFAAALPRRAGTDAIDLGAYEGAGTGGTTAPAPAPEPAPAPAPTPGVCKVATSSGSTVVTNTAMTQRTGRFTATADVTPGKAYMDGGVMLGQNTMAGWADGAVIVLFAGNGTIQARRGDAYAADASVPYKAGTSYRVRMDVDVTTHTYSVYVTPAGGTEVRIATNYGFRTAWKQVTALGTWAAIAGNASISACNFVN
jgi:hypothetical protein